MKVTSIHRRRQTSAVRRILITTLLLQSSLSVVFPGKSGFAAEETLTWDRLAPIPDSVGRAGAFAGVHGGALLVGGGANFPDGLPWEGGVKVWYDSVDLLDKPDGVWRSAGRLPRPLGYGVSLTTVRGIACLGGSDADRHYKDCLLLTWSNGEFRTDDLPQLPIECANSCGALVGNTIYLAGGIQAPADTSALRTFWSLNLDESPLNWRELDPWPGVGRMLAVAAVQDGSFFLVSGAALSAGPDGRPVREYLTDAYRYRPDQGWQRIADVPHAVVAAPTPAIPMGQSSFLIVGGDDGLQAGVQPPDAHRGFSTAVLAYHTITNTWKVAGHMPAGHVTATTVAWQNGFIVPSGEIRPGVRSPDVLRVRATLQKAAFGWLNSAMLLAYLLLMVVIGAACSRRNLSTDSFFRGGQRIPWWAAGLSIFATMLSSITFMAIPAAAYTDGWTLFLANSYILITPLVVFVFLPFYRRLDVTSAYEYLERRFNPSVRMLGSLLFMVYQCGRMAVVLYLPSLALATVSDLDIRSSILLMGTLCILYTVAGGIEAVIWTDVIQAFILVGGALLSLVFLLTRIDGGVMETLRSAAEGRHLFEKVNWSWDLTVASGWVILIGSLFHNLLPYTASQDVVQRYVTTRDERAAARGIWLNALVSVPAQALFFAIGTALYVFYRQHPERLNVTLQNDAIFPYYVMSELPSGVAGLIVAGIFAASQSTLSSSMNSIATAWVTDFHRRWYPQADDRSCLRIARLVSVLVGVTGMIVALVMARTDIRSFYSAFLEILGLFGGTLSGLFVLGIFSTRAHGMGALAGAVLSGLIVFSVRTLCPVHVYAYAPIGLISCFVSGWLISRLVPSTPRDLRGLTVYTSDTSR